MRTFLLINGIYIQTVAFYIQHGISEMKAVTGGTPVDKEVAAFFYVGIGGNAMEYFEVAVLYCQQRSGSAVLGKRFIKPARGLPHGAFQRRKGLFGKGHGGKNLMIIPLD